MISYYSKQKNIRLNDIESAIELLSNVYFLKTGKFYYNLTEDLKVLIEYGVIDYEKFIDTGDIMLTKDGVSLIYIINTFKKTQILTKYMLNILWGCNCSP